MKLRCDEGAIDFIVAPDLTTPAHEPLAVDGEHLVAETPVEIVTKKAFYLAVDLRPRDLFDLAVVIEHVGDGMAPAARVLATKRDVLRERLDILARRWVESAAAEIAVLPAGRVSVRPRTALPYLQLAANVGPMPCPTSRRWTSSSSAGSVWTSSITTQDEGSRPDKEAAFLRQELREIASPRAVYESPHICEYPGLPARFSRSCGQGRSLHVRTDHPPGAEHGLARHAAAPGVPGTRCAQKPTSWRCTSGTHRSRW